MIFNLQQNQNIISLQSQYILQNQTNANQFDKPWEALNDKSAKKFAIRFAQILTKSQKQVIRAIIKNSPFNHITNIYELMKPSQFHSSYVIVSDIVEGCFKDYWENNYKNFDEIQIIEFFTQIVKGVQELHSIDIFPSAINLENIVYVHQREGKLTLKISETALLIEDNQDNQYGKEQNFAKEQKKLSGSNHKMCIWSLGVLLYEMISKTNFFKEDSFQQKYKDLKQSEINELIDTESMSQGIKWLLKNMLVIDSEQNIDLQNVLQQLLGIKNTWQNIIKQIKLSSEDSQEKILLQLNVQKQDYESKLEQLKIEKTQLMEDKKECEIQFAQRNQRFYQQQIQIENEYKEKIKIARKELVEEYSLYYKQQIENMREIIIKEQTEKFQKIYGRYEMLLLEKLKESLIEIFENLYQSKAQIDCELMMNFQKLKNSQDEIEKDNLSIFLSQLQVRSQQINQFINEIKTIQTEAQINDFKVKMAQNVDINKIKITQLIDDQNQKYEKIIQLLTQEKEKQFQQINSLKDLATQSCLQKQSKISDIFNKIEGLKIIFLVCMIANEEQNQIIKIQNEVQKINPQLQNVVIEINQVKIESNQQLKKNRERLDCLNGIQNELIVQNYEQQLEKTIKLSLNAFKNKIKNNCQYEQYLKLKVFEMNQQNQQNVLSFQKYLFQVIDNEISFVGLLKNQHMIEPLGLCIRTFAEQSNNQFTSFQRIEMISNNLQQKNYKLNVNFSDLFKQLDQEMISFTLKLSKITDLSQIEQTMQNNLKQFIMSQKNQLTKLLKNIEQSISQLMNNEQFNTVAYLLGCGLDWGFVSLYSKIILDVSEINDFYFTLIEQYQDQIRCWEREKDELSKGSTNFNDARKQLLQTQNDLIKKTKTRKQLIKLQLNKIEKLEKSVFTFFGKSHWLEQAELQLQQFKNQINQYIKDQEQSNDQEKFIQNFTSILVMIEEIKNYMIPLQIQNIQQTKDELLENLKSYLKLFFCHFNFLIEQKICNLQQPITNNDANQNFLTELLSQIKKFSENSQQQDFFLRIEDENKKIYQLLQLNQQFFDGQLNLQNNQIFHRQLDELLQIKINTENKKKLKSVILDEQLIEQFMSQQQYKKIDGQLEQFKLYAKLKEFISSR